jgi:hypothetical protein
VLSARAEADQSSGGVILNSIIGLFAQMGSERAGILAADAFDHYSGLKTNSPASLRREEDLRPEIP